eukprot:5409765-Amphidinium_carterae.1
MGAEWFQLANSSPLLKITPQDQHLCERPEMPSRSHAFGVEDKSAQSLSKDWIVKLCLLYTSPSPRDRG